MRVNGEWLVCDDGITRNIVRAEMFGGDGHWEPLEMLVDTCADRSVISASILELLDIRTEAPRDRIVGVGGFVDSASCRTKLRVTNDARQKITFNGEFAACTDRAALDMSVLGRDILDMFALIVERKVGVVAILWADHTYAVTQAS